MAALPSSKVIPPTCSQQSCLDDSVAITCLMGASSRRDLVYSLLAKVNNRKGWGPGTQRQHADCFNHHLFHSRCWLKVVVLGLLSGQCHMHPSWEKPKAEAH